MRLAFLSLLLVMQPACDSSNEGPVVTLLPSSTEDVVLSNDVISMTLNRSGQLRSISMLPDVSQPNRRVNISNNLGMWVAGEQNGVRANVMSYLLVGPSSFQIGSDTLDGSGLYLIDAEEYSLGFDTWPLASGAPHYSDGSPKMLGDVMAWGAFNSVSDASVPESSLSGLQVVAIPYLFRKDGLHNTIFVRYKLTNLSSISIENLHSGFGGDIDLFLSDTDMEPIEGLCGRFNSRWNNTGYDLENHFSYTYVKPDPIDGNIPEECYGTFVGYSILGSTTANGLVSPMLASRILTRGPEESYEAFQEHHITAPQRVLYALQGLSFNGLPMINPVTNIPTAFAFSGNPIDETGWLDMRRDTRSLQSIAPFSLGPGETATTTVAIFTVASPTFEQGFDDMSTLFQSILSKRNTWDY